MRVRFSLSTPDWAIVIGAALMIFSAVGWYIDSPKPEPDRPAGLTIQSVPTLAVQPALVTAATSTAVPLEQVSGADFLVPVAGPVGAPDTAPTQPDSPDQAAADAPTSAAYPPPDPAATGAPGADNAQPTPGDSPTQSARVVPDRIEIATIGLDAPIFPSTYTLVQVEGQVFQQWQAPNSFAAGWQTSSVGLGAAGNTVLLGHNNINGEVFAHLVDLSEGNTIRVYAGDTVFEYQVTQKMILLEKGQDLSVRLKNASWLLPSDDERLTLVTCWPQDSNTHRLIIVARPVSGPP